ncbi:MAG: hypothetical protein ABIT96_00685, partial [Ferruginibacter sp.]
MKKSILFLVTFIFASIAFAQTTPPCPASYKRSNGAGGGCPIAKLTLIYTTCPDVAQPIDSVYQGGVRIDATFADGVISCSGSKYEVTYCVTSTNIAPTVQLTIYFASIGAFNGSTCTVAGSGPAPVMLTSFYAGRTNDLVALNWKTSLEVNAKEFILERSTGKDFEFVATIAAKNAANGASYSYTDRNNYKGIAQYRLKVIDNDGTYSYSDVRTVKGLSSVSDFTV